MLPSLRCGLAQMPAPESRQNAGPRHEAKEHQPRQCSAVAEAMPVVHAHRAGVSSMQSEPGASGMLPNVYWKGVDMALLRSHAKFLALPPVHGLTLTDHSSYR